MLPPNPIGTQRNKMDTPDNNKQQQMLQQEPQAELSEEQVYTSMAHVFEIDPKTKRSWTSKSEQAVPVSLIIDLRQRILRLIGTNQEQHKTIINSIILSKTVFTRTSQKFGQWTDSAANTVYGLGFASEIELNKFVNKFQEFKKLLPIVTPPATSNIHSSHQNQAHPHLTSSTSSSWMNIDNAAATVTNDINQISNDLANAQLSNNLQSHASNNQQRQQITTNSNNIPPDSNGNSMISDAGLDGADTAANNNNMGIHHRSQSLSGIQARMNSNSSTRNDQQQNSTGQNAKLSSRSTLAGANPMNNNYSPLSTRESQLKYENDRLRLALAKNSDNAKEWAVEVQKLRTKIQTLFGALQESSANQKEWQQQLSSLKSENAKYQLRILELEASNGDAEAKTMIQDKLDQLSFQLDEKESEMEILRKKLDEIQQEKNSSKINNGAESHDTSKQFEVVYAKFGTKVRELGQIHQEFGLLLESK